MMKWLRLALIPFTLFGGEASLSAKEHWTRIDGRIKGYFGYTSLTDFNEYVYLMREFSSEDTNLVQILRTKDSLTWENVPFPGVNLGRGMVRHRNSLFVFSQEILLAPPYGLRTRIHRTEDGANWTNVADPDLSTRLNYNFSLASFGEFIYAAHSYSDSVTREFRIFRTNGLGNPVAIETIAPPTHLDNPQLVVFEGALYLGGRSGHGESHVYRYQDNGTWVLSGIFNSTADIWSGDFSKGDDLFWGFDKIWKLAKGSTNWVAQNTGLSNAIPFHMYGRIHAYAPRNAVLVQNSRGEWETARDTACESAWMIDVVHHNNLAYVPLPCGLWTVKMGLISLLRENFVPQNLVHGQQNVTMMSLSIQSNIDEKIFTFKVENLGDAEAGLDVQRLRVFYSESGSSLEFWTDLIPQADKKTWITPPHFRPSQVYDGSRIVITADMASTAREGRKCLFALKEVKAVNNASFSLPAAIVAHQEQSVMQAAPALEAINGIAVVPTPVRDRAGFTYDLESVSDVTVKIFNLEGSLVARLDEVGKAQGRASTIWDASAVAPGVYFAIVQIKPSSGSERTHRLKVFVEK